LVPAPGRQGRALFFVAAPARTLGHDNRHVNAYIQPVRSLFILVPLFALLVAVFWFAGATWVRLGGDPIPTYGWFAIIGGVFFSLLVGGGLMALIFHSSRHGYDDLSGGDGQSH